MFGSVVGLMFGPAEEDVPALEQIRHHGPAATPWA